MSATAVLGWTAAGGTACLIDPYHRRLEGLRGWPNVDAVAGQREEDAAVALLAALHATMQRRHLDLLEGTVQHEDLTPILLAIDEFTDFTGWCEQIREKQTREGRDADRGPASVQQGRFPHQLLDEVLRGGRGARIHLAVRTTRVRRQQVEAFDQRVWIGPMSELDSRVLWSTPWLPASAPPCEDARSSRTPTVSWRRLRSCGHPIPATSSSASRTSSSCRPCARPCVTADQARHDPSA